MQQRFKRHMYAYITLDCICSDYMPLLIDSDGMLLMLIYDADEYNIILYDKVMYT